MTAYLVYYINNEGQRMYCTGIPGDDNPLGGIGYQRNLDGTAPWSAATAPTEEDARKVVEYLDEACGPQKHHWELRDE